MDFFQTIFLENTLGTWLTALAVLIISFILLQILKHILANKLSKLASRTSNNVDDLIAQLLKGTRGLFLFALAISLGMLALKLPEGAGTWIGTGVIVILLLQAGFWGSAIITYIVKREVNARVAANASSATAITALGFIGQVALWSILLLMALDNAGVEVTALVASLGVGGIAVALAVQNILGDLFAALSIVIDRPFAIGDFIIVDGLMGTVENIGLKSTRVRSLFGEELIFSNSDLLNSRIANYKTLGRRRVVFTVGITYGTPNEKVDKVPGMLKEIVVSQDKATFDRAHFKAFGDFSLIFEIVYYVEDAEYNIYMDIQQQINMSIYRSFENEGIEFAFPTQTVHVKGTPIEAGTQTTITAH